MLNTFCSSKDDSDGGRISDADAFWLFSGRTNSRDGDGQAKGVQSGTEPDHNQSEVRLTHLRLLPSKHLIDSNHLGTRKILPVCGMS